MKAKYPEAEFVDAKGGVIMPGLINAHTHIYSGLARGLSIAGNNPTNFLEVLDGTWWAIDRHLTLDGTKACAYATVLDCIRNGVTTIFDHHASFGEISGSLFAIKDVVKELGIRSCLCYEVSERDGEEKTLQSIKENADFAKWAKEADDDMVKAMFGGHALFTISDKTFEKMVEANDGMTGFHIHVSEGPNDVEDTWEKYKKRPVERLYDKGETRAAGPGPYNSIIPFKGNWILFEASADTVYTLMPDYSLRPLIARTPPIHTMDPGVFVVLRLISDRYYFMESVTNIYDFNTGEGFPRKYFAYDTQEKKFFNYITYNDDYSYKKEIYMVTFPPINSKGELCSTINASDLCQDYKRGKLKGKLKEVAATLEEDDNRVVVLVRPKK